MKNKISVFVIVNNKEIFNDCLKYIKKQTIFKYLQLIEIDNTNNNYVSASKAYNSYLNKASSDVYVFMHQDVMLLDNSLLEKYYDYLKDKQNVIIGAAGVTDKKGTVSDIVEGTGKIFRSEPTNGCLIKAISLDECIFACNSCFFLNRKFDEKTCNNWHLYCADMCFTNTLQNGLNYIYPSKIWHLSYGNNKSKSFEKSLVKLIKKYHFKKIKNIHTCCANEPANIIKYRLKELKKYITHKSKLICGENLFQNKNTGEK